MVMRKGNYDLGSTLKKLKRVFLCLTYRNIVLYNFANVSKNNQSKLHLWQGRYHLSLRKDVGGGWLV